jgi:NADH-quinone oxidoreductase subunit L
MAMLVSFISVLVLLFSRFYMRKEKQSRFYAEMSFFIFSMLGLVIANSLLLLFIFWEFVGIASYLLIGFWYDREEPAVSSKKALIITRIGDLSFLTAVIVLFSSFKTFSISDIIGSLATAPHSVLVLSGALLTIAAFSKAAQFPFYTWLIDAMEGPTPVSALLHSATMVAAGVYLLIRLLPIVSIAGMSEFIVLLAFITAFISAVLALKERHLKKILAYSTIESLAFMFMAIGTLNAGGALFYLFTHAIFKSMLFFITGIFAIFFGTYDIYLLKDKRIRMSWVTVPAIIGFASIAAIPPFMSFFAHSALTYNFNIYENIAFVIVSFITALFSFRALFVVFGKRARKPLKKEFNTVFPVVTLVVLSTIGGVFLYFFGSIITMVQSFDYFSFISLAAVFLGVVISYFVFYKGKAESYTTKARDFAEKFENYRYEKLIITAGKAVSALGYGLAEFDSTLVKSVSTAAESTFFLSSKLREIENGDAFRYLTAIIIGVVAVVILAVVFV